MSNPTTSPLRTGAKAALCIGALGVVFGDIGTSPLYTMKECMAHLPEGVDQVSGVYGVLSLIFWLLVLVVSVKYLWFVMAADNQGEGGIFALLALLQKGREPGNGSGLGPTVLMILVGAALLYGDGIITPAITVLGAAGGPGNFQPPLYAWADCVDCLRHFGRVILGPAARNEEHRRGLRADHGRMVRSHRDSRSPADRSQPHGAEGA
jgi:KUP system potassium uptake protein